MNMLAPANVLAWDQSWDQPWVHCSRLMYWIITMAIKKKIKIPKKKPLQPQEMVQLSAFRVRTSAVLCTAALPRKYTKLNLL